MGDLDGDTGGPELREQNAGVLDGDAEAGGEGGGGEQRGDGHQVDGGGRAGVVALLLGRRIASARVRYCRLE